MQQLGTPHIDSFNYMLDGGLENAVREIFPVNLTLANNDKIALWVEDATIYQPMAPTGTIGVRNHKIYPTECRQRGSTYKGKLVGRIGWSINGKLQEHLEKDLGEIPIMIKVNTCEKSVKNNRQAMPCNSNPEETGVSNCCWKCDTFFSANSRTAATWAKWILPSWWSMENTSKNGADIS